jgi:hypothetical protein
MRLRLIRGKRGQMDGAMIIIIEDSVSMGNNDDDL